MSPRPRQMSKNGRCTTQWPATMRPPLQAAATASSAVAARRHLLSATARRLLLGAAACRGADEAAALPPPADGTAADAMAEDGDASWDGKQGEVAKEEADRGAASGVISPPYYACARGLRGA